VRSGLSLRVLIGSLLIGAGIALLLLGKFRIPFGRLPGDIAWRGKNFTFYFPLSTSIMVSVLLTLLLYLISRFRR
jgi:ribose/xylose/arabinose/galactoside ABC-type transport system permease subunit